MQPTHHPTSQPITGPRGWPLLGVLPQFARDPVRFLCNAARDHDGIARLDLGRSAMYLVTRPDHYQHILQDNHRNYGRGYIRGHSRSLMGNGLPFADGDSWLHQRRLMQPAFHRQRLAEMVDGIAATTRETVDGWQAHAQSGQPLDVASEMMRLTLHIIVKAMFSTDVRDDLARLEQSFNLAQQQMVAQMRRPVSLPLSWPTPSNRRFHQAVQTVDEIVYRIIDERQRQSGSAADGAQDEHDLLSMLLAARDEETGHGMSQKQVRDEVVTIFFAGHETTATTLAWVWYALARHPDVAARAAAEVDEVLGQRRPSFGDLPHLSYTKRIIQETMRLHTPVWIFTRRAEAEDEVGGYRVPAGASIFLSPYVTHHDPALWPEPQRFDPDRFLPEREAERPRFHYLPFGGGPHLCIGNSFALMEAQLVIATVLQRFRLRLVTDAPVVGTPQVTLRPKGGLPMVVERI